MTPRSAEARVHVGDVAAVCASLEADSFDAVLCDPPYGLSFMGKRWDYDVPNADLWREVLRVCKPGAPLVAFSGTRTYHRTVVQIEDAGWEIRDCLAWMYGSGFPKSLDVSKALDAAAGAERKVVGQKWAERYPNGPGGNTFSIGEGTDGKRTADNTLLTAPATDAARQWQGYGTALKPAFEPAVLARKPLDGTVANNVQRWGVGALAIDACRIGEGAEKTPAPTTRGDSKAWFTTSDASNLGGNDNVGRWPANVLLDEEAGEALDAQTGPLHTRGNKGPSTSKKDLGVAYGKYGPASSGAEYNHGGSGGASRFLYCAKATRWERNLGCDDLPMRTAAEMTDSEEGQARLDSPRTGAGRTSGARNHHPTVKPIMLTRWLARLIAPPRPIRILVPFAGSGSEMLGAILEGWPEVVGIEREEEYAAIARARCALALANPRAFEPEAETAPAADPRQLAGGLVSRTSTQKGASR
jgi:DNA modification methylase